MLVYDYCVGFYRLTLSVGLWLSDSSNFHLRFVKYHIGGFSHAVILPLGLLC